MLQQLLLLGHSLRGPCGYEIGMPHRRTEHDHTSLVWRLVPAPHVRPQFGDPRRRSACDRPDHASFAQIGSNTTAFCHGMGYSVQRSPTTVWHRDEVQIVEESHEGV